MGTGCGIVILFCLDDRLNLLNHTSILRTKCSTASHNRVKLTSTALRLELGDLRPDVVRDALVAAERLEGAGELELGEEASEHLVLLADGVEVHLEDLVKLLGEHLDVCANLGRDQVSELTVKLGSLCQLCFNIGKFDEVLRVEGRELLCTRLLLIVDCLVVVTGLAEKCVNLF